MARVYLHPSDPSRGRRLAFARRVVSRMRELEMTQEDVAHYVGASQASVSDWINPKVLAQPNTRYIIRLARLLQVNLEWLLCGDGPKERFPGTYGKPRKRA